MLRSLIARRRLGPRTRWRPLREALASGLGLGDVFGLARRGSAVGFRLLWHAVELAVNARLCLLWWLVWFLCFRFGALAGLGAFVRAGFLCFSVLGVASGPRVKLAGCKSALGPRWFALLAVLGRWSRCWSCSLLLCGLFFRAMCCMSFHVSFCSCVF